MVSIHERVEPTQHQLFGAWIDLVASDERLTSKVLVGLYETESQAWRAAAHAAQRTRQAYARGNEKES